MRDTLYRHPLAALRAHLGLSATAYLTLLDQRHRALGLGAMAIRREKVCRWESGLYAPEPSAQLAMADLHAVPAVTVASRGWPDWLLAAEALHSRGDDVVLRGPWSTAGTIAALAADVRRDSMDRRGFLIATGAGLTTITHGWLSDLHTRSSSGSVTGRRRLTADMVSHLDQRLDHLRRLDDVLGGAELRQAALAECKLAQRLATDTIYDDVVARRLYSTISEAARICGWQHFDADLHAAAQRFYTTSLRASATGGDPQAGAHTLGFMAIQTYSVGSPVDAVRLAEAAVEQTRHTVTPRTDAMLHVRLARALSKTPDGGQRCLAELDRAQDAYARGTHDDDPPWTYWLTVGELEMLAGSCALDLGRPDRALDHFATARELHYAAEGHLRDEALYLTRAATAHLDRDDVGQACAVARQALARSSTVDSTRPTGALREFRARLSAEHPGHRDARAFLAQHREATITAAYSAG